MTTVLFVSFVIIFSIFALAYRDYRNWLALGKGGLPSNLRGWLLVTRMRFQKKDPLEVKMYTPEIGSADDHSYLGDLPRRNGPRPDIAPWPIPHRQLNQFIATGMREKLDAAFDNAVSANAGLVHYKMSFFEKHSPAVTLCHPECGHTHAIAGQGETAHIHPGDGSMHMIFSVTDATKVIQSGWGERHPLSGAAMNILPNTYLYVYPPRDDAELEIVERLLAASIAHMTKAKTRSA